MTLAEAFGLAPLELTAEALKKGELNNKLKADETVNNRVKSFLIMIALNIISAEEALFMAITLGMVAQQAISEVEQLEKVAEL